MCVCVGMHVHVSILCKVHVYWDGLGKGKMSVQGPKHFHITKERFRTMIKKLCPSLI